MARSYFENWMEIFFILIMLLGIVMAVVVRSNIVSYMTITAAGVAAGKIIFERKNKVRFPYILIIIGFIIGYVIGAYDASRRWKRDGYITKMAGKITICAFIVSAIILLFLTGCSGQDAEIKEGEADAAKIETVQVSAEDVSSEEEAAGQEIKQESSNAVKSPSLKIISPKDLEMINGKDVKIVFEVSIWLDSIEKKSADTEVVFRDAGRGRHSIVAELRKSDGTPIVPVVREGIAVTVNDPEGEELQKPKPVNAEADDFGFYPSSINVKRNQVVDLNITVRKENVYFNGLEFESKYFETGKVYPGDSKVVQFVPNEDFKVTSYWPSSRTKKADLQIVVE
ncbi:hypothetical protein HYU10_01820 [Candidatus Woesearchaeota archaeon]|nr:hypothetical protein [Candidatus Woesearchaeota archaeon]